MLITYHGHAQFLLETADGYRILTDPYNAETGYPMHPVKADAVTMSHGHADHTEVSKVQGNPLLLRELGPHTLPHGIRVQGYQSFHDDKQGTLRGLNTCFVIEADGLKIAHLGDIGALPDDTLARALRGVDVMMLPVGGHYTIDAQQAAQIVQDSGARIAIPMHYRNDKGGYEVIATVDGFTRLMPAPSHQPLLRVTKGDLSEQPRCVVLEIQAG